MKILILITVIESLAVMFAIMYFYYRRSQKIRRFADGTTLLFQRANGEDNSRIKKSRPANADSIHSPLKGG
jgi:hypothetical protein